MADEKSMPDPSIQVNNRDVVTAFIEELHTEYEVWYAKSCRLNYRLWYILQFVALLSGFLASIFVAMQTKDSWSNTIKTICVILPSLGSLAGTIILQFKLFETWKLREDGRISFQNLVNYSKSELLKCKTEDDYQKLHEALSLKTNEIENTQSNNFFSLYATNFIAAFTTK